MKDLLVLDHKYRKYKLNSYSASFLSGTLNDKDTGGDTRDHLIYGKHGRVLEAAKANLGLIAKDTLYLVDKQQNILPGVMQEILATNYSKWFRKLKLVNGFTGDDIKSADEMLYLNSLVLCLPIKTFSGVSFRAHFSQQISDFLFAWK